MGTFTEKKSSAGMIAGKISLLAEHGRKALSLSADAHVVQLKLIQVPTGVPQPPAYPLQILHRLDHRIPPICSEKERARMPKHPSSLRLVGVAGFEPTASTTPR